MAYPSHISSSAIHAASSGTTTSVTIPPHVADDIIVVVGAYNAESATMTLSGTWNQIHLQPQATHSRAIWWTRATGTNSVSNPTFTTITATATDGRFAQAHVFRGCVTSGNPFDDASSAVGNATTIRSEKVDVWGDERLVVCFALMKAKLAAADTTSPPPSGWTTESDVETTTAGDWRFVTCSTEVASPTTVAATTMLVSTSTAYSSFTVAFRPDSPTAWAGPEIVGSSAIAAATSGTTVSPTLPSHVTDDIFVCVAMKNDAATLTIAGGGTWTELLAPQSSSNMSSAVWYRRAASGSETNPTVTSSSTANATTAGFFAQVHVIRGVTTSDPPVEGTESFALTTGNNHSNNTVTTTDLDRLCVSFYVGETQPYTIVGGPSAAGWYVESQLDSTASTETARFNTIYREQRPADTLIQHVQMYYTTSWRRRSVTTAFIPEDAPQELVPDAIAAATTVHNPTLAAATPQALAPNAIAAATSVFEPTLANTSQTVTPDAVAAATTVHNPTIASATPQALSPDALAAATTVHEPTLSDGAPQSATPDHVAAATAVHGPVIANAGTQVLAPDAVAAATTVHEPTVASASQVLAPDTVAAATVLHEPTVALATAQSLAPDAVASDGAVHEPTLENNVHDLSPDSIAASTTVHGPTVAAAAPQGISPDAIAAATTVRQPTVAAATPQELTPGAVASTSVIYEPVMTGTLRLFPDHIAADTYVFEPTLRLSASRNGIGSAGSSTRQSAGSAGISTRQLAGTPGSGSGR